MGCTMKKESFSHGLCVFHNLIIDYFRKSNRMPKFEASDDYDVFQFITDNAPNAENNLIKTV